METVVQSPLEQLRLSLVRSGVPVKTLERDLLWEQRQEPEVRHAPGFLYARPVRIDFYPMMLRWAFESGEKRLLWLRPIIDESRDRPVLDYQRMLEQFRREIVSDAERLGLRRQHREAA